MSNIRRHNIHGQLVKIKTDAGQDIKLLSDKLNIIGIDISCIQMNLGTLFSEIHKLKECIKELKESIKDIYEGPYGRVYFESKEHFEEEKKFMYTGIEDNLKIDNERFDKMLDSKLDPEVSKKIQDIIKKNNI